MVLRLGRYGSNPYRQVQNLSPPGLNFAQAKGLKFCTGGAYILHDPTVTIYIGLFREEFDYIYKGGRRQ